MTLKEPFINRGDQEFIDARYNFFFSFLAQTSLMVNYFKNKKFQFPAIHLIVEGKKHSKNAHSAVLSTITNSGIRPSKKKKMFLVRISIKKKEAGGLLFCYLLFPIACFLYTLLPSPRDTLELLGQV